MRVKGRRIPEFEASLVYRGSSRTVRAMQRNPVGDWGWGEVGGGRKGEEQGRKQQARKEKKIELILGPFFLLQQPIVKTLANIAINHLSPTVF